MKPPHDLPELLDALDPQARLVQRQLWLIALFQWLRGDCRSIAASLARGKRLLDAAQVRAQTQQRLHVTQAIARRWRHAPLSFFWPTRDSVSLPATKD